MMSLKFSWYQAFVSLLIQTDTAENSTDINTANSIGASLVPI